MAEISQSMIFGIAMVALLPLVVRSKDTLLAWAIVFVSLLVGQIAGSELTGVSLLLAYAVNDGIAGVLVQTPSRFPFRLMGSAYGAMGLSHVALHFGLLAPKAHDLVGETTGWGLLVVLACIGLWDGGHRNRASLAGSLGGGALGAVTTNKEAS